MKATKKTKSGMSALVFTIVLTAVFVLAGCDSGSDSGGSGGSDQGGSNPSGSNPGGTNTGGTLSGMYYSEQRKESQITFRSDGSCTWVTPYTDNTYNYTVVGNSVMMEIAGIMVTYFYVYNSDTLISGDNLNLSNSLYLKDGSSYPVSGAYRNSNTGTYWIFDGDGFCTLALSADSTEDRKWSYTVSGRIISTIYLPSNSPGDNSTFTVIDSSTLKMQQTGFIWRKN